MWCLALRWFFIGAPPHRAHSLGWVIPISSQIAGSSQWRRTPVRGAADVRPVTATFRGDNHGCARRRQKIGGRQKRGEVRSGEQEEDRSGEKRTSEVGRRQKKMEDNFCTVVLYLRQ